MLGKLGFGKTFTIAYVVQYLRDGDVASNTPTTDTLSTTAPSASQPRRNKYLHYCKKVVQYLRNGDVASNTPMTDTLSITAPSASQPRRNKYFHCCKYVVQCLRDSDVASNTPTTDTLSITAPSASQPRRNIYFHYCKDDGTTNKALNVFHSLLSQLLKDHEHLRPKFDSDVQKLEKSGSKPLSDPSRMKWFLVYLVVELPPPTFLIIDALDECLLDDRRVLLDFLEEIIGRKTSTRILTSARASHLHQSEKLFPRTAVPICFWDLRDLRQRDRCIAEFLVKHHMSHVSENRDVRQLLVDNLTSGMQGSAIWAQMTLQYLITMRRTSFDTIQLYLENNRTPQPLKQLYLGVFKNVTGDNDECKWLLARSLELIAGARRGLTFDELLYALSLYTPPSSTGGVSRVTDVAELRRNLRGEVGEDRMRQLLRPFADLKPTVGFMHQSLKHAVLEYPELTEAAQSRQQGWTGVSGIQGVMLKTCVDYFMLKDFNWPETSTATTRVTGVTGEMSQVHQNMWDDHRKMWLGHRKMSRLPSDLWERCPAFLSKLNGLTEVPVSSNTDPFGAFFHYAAHCFTDHLGSAPVDFILDDVLELASPTSARHKAWMLESEVLYPKFSPSTEPSALCLLACVGNVPMLEQQLDRLAKSGGEDIRLIVAAALTIILNEKYGNFRALMNHRITGKAMRRLRTQENFREYRGVLRFRSNEPAELARLVDSETMKGAVNAILRDMRESKGGKNPISLGKKSGF